jgi:hypothetical protein
LPNENDDRLEKAREHWQINRPLEAGRLIFESLPVEERVPWATNILKLVIEKSGVRHPAIEQLQHFADHPAEWQNARSFFSDLRDSTLKLERSWFLSSGNATLLDHLYLAENVAKVVYN